MADYIAGLMILLQDVTLFAEHSSGIRLRSYQRDAAIAIADSVINRRGRSFVVIFPRQSGKNELQAQIETYLMTLYSIHDVEIVKVSPTWKPQSLNAMRRLERVLKRNTLFTAAYWKKEQGYIYKLGGSRIYFLSGAPTSNIVGATAGLLLECDEAQDISIEKFDKEINPMAASTNATKVFWGTAWTSQTLLAREKRAALEAEKKDGCKRFFELSSDQVRNEVPAYGKFVDGEIAKLGRNHPFVKTQYFSEEIDAQSGMFPLDRLAIMKGTHPYHFEPKPGLTYAFCIDVGGEDFTGTDAISCASESRDSTALTIFQIDFSTLADELIRAPTYNTVYRKVWTGVSHTVLYTSIKALANLWNPVRIIIDATGVGEGIASFLGKTFQSMVVPFKFSLKSKSDLAWSFLAVIESGRYKEYYPIGRGGSATQSFVTQPAETQLSVIQPSDISPDGVETLQRLFWQQCELTSFEILPGPGQMVRWGVPVGARHPATGKLVHDDLVLSAALVALLDQETGLGQAETAIVEAYDPLKEMSF